MKDALENLLKDQEIPFGATVEYHPISAKDKSKLHQFGPKVLPGFFSVMHCTWEDSGKETLWSQTLKNWRRWTHLVADGTVQISGEDQVLRTSTLTRDRPDRGEEQENLLGESDWSSSAPISRLIVV